MKSSREDRPSAAGKTCSVCRKTIQARYADSAYHCSVPSCTQVCHLTRTCSGYIEPRREVRDRILATREWKCQQRNDMRMKEVLPLGQQHPRQHGNLRTQQRHPIEQQHLREPCTLRTQERQSIEQKHLQRNIALQTQGRQPTQEQHLGPAPPSLNDLRAQGMTFAEAKQARERCGKCSKILRSNTVLVRCKLCAKSFHQKCNTGPHNSDRDEDWKCPNCAVKQNAQREALAQDKNRIISQPVPSTSRQKLTILQSNADGIMTKFTELRDRLINSDIDICAVQESKLRKNNKTPIIEGFATLRKDRKVLNGGGLLLYIRSDLTFEKLQSAESNFER